eukprot:TRINITY_DN14021_c0_g1_i1.p1 TRINITY_DN14021_c0_g1~~TRINITY_DN14021_c0_g1_i1.p1  ORF type:complete len:363 (+),score=47.74 TRINITY_DN14021_c0_g1_i1:483-1571(+)
MNVFVLLSDYPSVSISVTAETLVEDAVKAAAAEWGVDVDLLELSYSGSVLPCDSKLISHGVEGDSQLTASLVNLFGRKWFKDYKTQGKLIKHLTGIGEQHLCLDTSTFSNDGCVKFDHRCIQKAFKSVSFLNADPSVTSVQFEIESWIDIFKLSTANLPGFRNVTAVGDSFFEGSLSLTDIDIPSLVSVRTIGNKFLLGCLSLSKLDFSSLTNVTAIGSQFLDKCDSVVTLDLTGLSNLTTIGWGFAKCKSLTTVNLADLHRVTSIDMDFLSHCSSLVSIDLTHLRSLTHVGKDFLYGCSSLTEVDLSSFNNVTSMNTRGFLDACPNLKVNNISTLGGQIKTLGDLGMLGVDRTPRPVRPAC